MTPLRRTLPALLSAAALTAGGLSACTSKAAEDHDLIALLLPDRAAARWDEHDQPEFSTAVQERCPDCRVRVYNAEGDAQAQLGQLQETLDEGADVVVAAAVTENEGAELVAAAGKVPVVAYDRFLPDADYSVSFETKTIGRMLAEAITALAVKAPDGRGPERPGPRILMLNGPDGDPNAPVLKKTAHRIFDKAKVDVLAEEDPPDWGSTTARDWTAEQLKRLGNQQVDAVYAASDSQAQGVAGAFADAKRETPLITGQDGELDALRRIIGGEQAMTVYKAVPREARAAARIATDLVAGRTPDGTTDHQGVASIMLEPEEVTIANLTTVTVRTGGVTISQLCPPELREACEEQGIA